MRTVTNNSGFPLECRAPSRKLNKMQKSIDRLRIPTLFRSGRGQHNQTTPSPFTRAFRVLPSSEMPPYQFFSSQLRPELVFLLVLHSTRCTGALSQTRFFSGSNMYIIFTPCQRLFIGVHGVLYSQHKPDPCQL